MDFRGPALDEEVQIGEDVKQELQTKRTIIDKNTGKPVEVDIYERAQPKKKVDPTKQRAMLSSNLEQSIIPADISKEAEFIILN